MRPQTLEGDEDMGTNLIRALLLASASVVAAGAAVPTAAYAQEATYQLDIPAQSMGGALRSLGQKTKRTILFNEELVRGKRSAAVRGRMTVGEALAKMVAGSGLVVSSNSSGFVVQGGNGSSAASSGAQQGQAILVGSVRDHATGAALKGARVEVVETGASTSTGDLGDFRFARLPTGDITLRISYLGFPEQSETVSVVGGLNNRTEIYLGSGATSEIVVYGQVSARAQALNQERTAENSTTVVSGDLLGNFNGTTISDALRRAPGVSFQQNDRTGDGTNIIIRGLSPDYNQLVLNGVPLPEGSGTGRSANLSDLLADSVSEIKISKTLLASQDSSGTGGLVEIETKSPLDRPKRYFNLSVDGTQRAKGFGHDYHVSATASAKIADNFGVSASYQYRDQDATTYSYFTQGVPGAYLPLLPNGQPAESSDIDPRTPFPFFEGGEYYINDSTASRNSAQSRTTNLTLSAEWEVGPSTNLRMDYVRSRRTTDTLDVGYSLRLDSNFYSIAPVPAPNGPLHYVFGSSTNNVNANTNVTYENDTKTDADSVSFRGNSEFGALSLDYRAGYSRGASSRPAFGSFGLGDYLFYDSALFSPDAIDPATNSIVSLFGPRSGRRIPIPNLSAQGFEALRNSPLPYLGSLYLSNTKGRSTNWTGRIDAKYEFGSGLLRYVEAGLDYKRSNYRNVTVGTSIYDPVYDPVTFLPPVSSDAGLEFDTFSFGSTGEGDALYRFATRDSVEAYLANRDQLLADGLVTLLELPPNPLDDRRYTRENNLAGYVQGRFDIGRLEVIAGLRIDRNLVAAGFENAVQVYDVNDVRDEAYYNQSLMIVEGSDTVTTYLPRILVNFRPSENLVFRAGYFSTVARPQIRQLNSARSITLRLRPNGGPTRSQPRLTIFQGNPSLKPARTHNFDVSGEWYDDDVGVLKVSLFYKRITNLLESTETIGLPSLEGADLPDHPAFQNLPSNLFVTFRQPRNSPNPASVWGAEISFEKRLTFLPGLLSGLGIYSNYAYSDSRKTQTLTWFSAPITNPDGTITRTNIQYDRILPFEQSPKHSGTAGLTYTAKDIDASLFYSIQARRLSGPAEYYLDSFNEAVDSLDFRAVYRFTLAASDVRLSFEGLNLLKSREDANTETSIGGVRGTPKYYTGGFYSGGRSFRLGLSATF